MLSYTVIGLLTVLVFLLYKLATRNFDYWKKRRVPYVKPSPIFGNFFDLFALRTTVGEYFEKLYNDMKEHPCFGIFVFNKPVLVVRSPELIKTILVKDFYNFPDRVVSCGQDDSLARHMLFLGKSPDWKVMRSKISPTFSTGRQKNTIPIINEIAEEMKRYIHSNMQSTIEAKELCAKFGTDLIARIAFSVKAHSFENEVADFRRLSRLLFDYRLKTAVSQTVCWFLPELAKLFNVKFIDPAVTVYLRKTFWDVIEQRKANNFKGNDVIDVTMELLKNEEFCQKMNFAGDKALAPAFQFFVAGSDTIATTVAFTLYELAINPDIQKRLRAEILECIRKHNGVTYEAIKDMRYLHMCVSETLRLYPVLPFLDRNTVSDYQIPGTDTVIERGTLIYIPMFGVHMDPELWTEPKKFDPERFSESNLPNIKPFSYLPFGIGPRICVGERLGMMATKMALIHIVSEFKVTNTANLPHPISFEPKALLITAKGGLPIKFESL